MKTVFMDVAHMVKARHHSGLVRVSERLKRALEAVDEVEVVPVQWHERKRCLVNEKGKAVPLDVGSFFLQVPPVSPDERPGLLEYLGQAGVKRMAVFHDAIPLKHPEITWPKSVARHPAYMKSLAGYEHVFAVSDSSMEELKAYWKWLGVAARAKVSRMCLGADFCEDAKAVSRAGRIRDVLMVGILEPRKNQALLLDVWEALAVRSDCPELHLVGRVNPHFGKVVLKRIQKLKKRGIKVSYYEGLDDVAMRALYDRCSIAMFPSIAEGCGLPVLEALWMGLPVVCSPLPSHRESAEFGGVKVLDDWAVNTWVTAFGKVLDNSAEIDSLLKGIDQDALPRWSGSAEAIIKVLKES